MSKITIEYHKQCRCSSTASGPRLLESQTVQDGVLTISFQWVEMACDECDKPWRRVIKPQAEREEQN